MTMLAISVMIGAAVLSAVATAEEAQAANYNTVRSTKSYVVASSSQSAEVTQPNILSDNDDVDVISQIDPRFPVPNTTVNLVAIDTGSNSQLNIATISQV